MTVKTAGNTYYELHAQAKALPVCLNNLSYKDCPGEALLVRAILIYTLVI